MTDAERKKLFDRAKREALKKRTALQRDARAETIKLLETARAGIRQILAAQPSDYQQWRLPQVQAQIERQLDTFRRGASTGGAATASQAWEAGTQLVEAPLRAAGVEVGFAGIDHRALDAMKLFMTDRIKGLSNATLDQINTDLGLVILGAQSPGEAIGRIAQRLGDPVRQRAITIVRTEVGRAFSAAAQARMEEALPTVPGLKKMWRRSGKIHSRAGHDEIDGQVREIDKPFEVISKDGEVIKLLFPRDPAGPPGETINCGCESLPFMESWTSVTRKQPFTERELDPRELARNPVKAAFAAAQRQ